MLPISFDLNVTCIYTQYLFWSLAYSFFVQRLCVFDKKKIQ